ncbi:hypothetical protein H8356DRAFT_1419858 [Neocallimastix lanati (nom. inval.)]|nr:hypothetical protein H8356DRAFT_1419858 [Neocallimastix sp. JGI-2020a]
MTENFTAMKDLLILPSHIKLHTSDAIQKNSIVVMNSKISEIRIIVYWLVILTWTNTLWTIRPFLHYNIKDMLVSISINNKYEEKDYHNSGNKYCWVFFMKIKFEFDKNSNNGLQYFVKRMVMFINLQYLIIHNKMDDPNKIPLE